MLDIYCVVKIIIINHVYVNSYVSLHKKVSFRQIRKKHANYKEKWTHLYEYGDVCIWLDAKHEGLNSFGSPPQSR